MAKMFKGGLADWIRGSQSIVHEWRMLSQSLLYTFVAGLIVVLISTAWFSWSEMSSQERHTVRVYAQASFNIAILSDPTKLVRYTEETGQVWLVRSDKFANSNMVKDALGAMFRGAGVGAAWGAAGMTTFVSILIGFFYVAGRGQSTEDYIRGAQTGEAKALIRALAKYEGGPGVLRLGKIVIPRQFEPQHMQFVGATGAGKSQAISRLLEGVRNADQRAVVYDVNGAFVETFYRPGVDVILNPLDVRCPPWNLWSEVRTGTDYNQLATSLIPDNTHNEFFWAASARNLFSSVAKKIAAEAARNEAAPTNAELVEIVTKLPMPWFTAYCHNTKAQAIMSEKSEKMTASVRATLAVYMEGFNLLNDEEVSFSIRDFVKNEEESGWLFITSKNDQLDALRGLITLWVDTAIATLLSMNADDRRRLWFVFDELTSLNRLNTLPTMMNQSRKFGGCAALGYQSFAQLVEIYKREGAEAIAGNCSSWFLFRANDPMTAQWCSESMGKAEKDEAQEGVSVGRHEMRDGRTLQKQRVERAVVLPSELRNLRNLHFYISLGRGLPIVKHMLAYRQFASFAKGFIPAWEKAPPGTRTKSKKPRDAGDKTEDKPAAAVDAPARDDVFADDDDVSAAAAELKAFARSEDAASSQETAE